MNTQIAPREHTDLERELCLCGRCRLERGETAPWSGSWDPAALQEVCDEMDLRWPLAFACVRLEGRTNGCCSQAPHDGDRWKHIVNIDPRQGAEDANHCALHELRHAQQVERETPELHRAKYAMFTAMFGYRDNPYEEDARRYADEHSSRLIIIKE